MQKASARIFLFGGHYDGGEGTGYHYLNDTHILDIDENLWTQPRCRGTAPESRYGHSAALVGTRVVYFGGKGKGKHFRDLHALDAASLTWYQGPSSGGAPSARQGHTATLHGTRLYVFGGVCGGKYFGDLHCLDLSSMAWSSLTTTGPKPTSRFGHTAVLIGESLLIHGGFCMDSADLATKDNSGDLLRNCYLNDMRVLDLGRMLWSRLRTHGEPPVGRYGHTLVLSDDDAILFGGWSGAKKEPSAAAAFSLQDKVKGEAEVKEEDQSSDFCMTLRTSDMQWIRNKYVGVAASRRYGHSATAIGPHLIIIGGWDGGKPLNDVIVLRDKSVMDKGNEDNLFGGGYEGDDGQGYADDDQGYGDFDFGGDGQEFDQGDDWTLDTGA
jgi:N-acetylneuraminic acid mutarotase